MDGGASAVACFSSLGHGVRNAAHTSPTVRAPRGPRPGPAAAKGPRSVLFPEEKSRTAADFFAGQTEGAANIPLPSVKRQPPNPSRRWEERIQNARAAPGKK